MKCGFRLDEKGCFKRNPWGSWINPLHLGEMFTSPTEIHDPSKRVEEKRNHTEKTTKVLGYVRNGREFYSSNLASIGWTNCVETKPELGFTCSEMTPLFPKRNTYTKLFKGVWDNKNTRWKLWDFGRAQQVRPCVQDKDHYGRRLLTMIMPQNNLKITLHGWVWWVWLT